MHHLIKCALDTQNLGLKMSKMRTKSLWNNICLSNSNYAKDPGKQRSIHGFISYVIVLPVSGQSKAQRSITLFSSEAEWVAL